MCVRLFAVLARVAVAAGCALQCSLASAHHSPAAYDMSAPPVVIEGRLAEVSWRNPHVYLALETTQPDGKITIQQVEAGAVSFLVPLGVTRESLAVGTAVTVTAFPSRRGDDGTVFGLTLTTSDGKVVPLFPPPLDARAEAGAEAQSLEGVWFMSTAEFVARVSQYDWPLNEAGRRLSAELPQGAAEAQAVCTPMPPPLVMLWPVVRTIEFVGDTAIIEVDTLDTRRIVHLDGRGHPEDIVPSSMGHSIGRWEGETLVVDTVGFDENPQGINFSVPSSSAKHLVERFTLADDRRALLYAATLTDPAYLSKPAEITSRWNHRPGLEPTGEPCDPETARRFLLED